MYQAGRQRYGRVPQPACEGECQAAPRGVPGQDHPGRLVVRDDGLPDGQRVLQGRRVGMLGGQTVVGENHVDSGSSTEAGGPTAGESGRPDAVTATVEVQDQSLRIRPRRCDSLGRDAAQVRWFDPGPTR